MLIKEFRVALPLTVEEYQIGQLYSVAEASKNETGGGEGVEVVKNEPFDNFPLLGGQFTKGQYTYKIYHLDTKVPSLMRLITPKGALAIHEEAWNAYPYCKTVITNPDYMKDGFKLTIETVHAPDRGIQENVHQLPPELLKQREVIYIDIANDPVQQSDYKPDEDPKNFTSTKTGRGPLKGEWRNEVQPVMCAYKLVTVEFKWFGLQNKVESFIQKFERKLFLNFHRQVFCWIDKWHGLTMKDIRELEEKTRLELDQLVQKRFRFSSTATGLTDSERLLIDSIKRRAPKKKPNVYFEVEGLSDTPVVALSTAEEYNLEAIQNAIIKQGLYHKMHKEVNEFDDEVIHLTAKYKVDEKMREFFLFREGSIVFWNMSPNECELFLKFLRDYEINSYDHDIVNEEREEIDVVYTNSSKSRLSNGLIHLNLENDQNVVNLEKFAFSNAIALSVKLSIWEANLDRYIDSIAYITQDMKEGRKIKLTREQVFQKTGQLFGLRHRLNLSSDMLDTPDFYWDREELERLFSATYSHLNINKRTKVMNEKLNHCIELMDLLSAHLNDIHHVRLEWMIIVLIMIEVFFEIMHYIERLAVPIE
ncbi:hypothetical protein BLOT_003341 [Blomia tropicalis]|nr:hypothetical protein BLOT_003341 [Blomia tropicalis]